MAVSGYQVQAPTTLKMTGLFLVATAMPVNAEYVLSITGPSIVNPGQMFSLSAVLTSDANDRHDSMLFDVRFSGPADVVYWGYLLDPVTYLTGGQDDFSVPRFPDPRPFLFPGYTICAVRPCVSDYSEVHIEAVTRSAQTFWSGTLVTMDFLVPLGTPPGERYTVEITPDTFALGLDVVETVSGGPFQFFVNVPELGTLAFLVLGGIFMARRRSKNSSPPPLRSHCFEHGSG